MCVGNKGAQTYRHRHIFAAFLVTTRFVANQILLQHDLRVQEHISWLRHAAVSAVVACATILSHCGTLVTDVPMYKPWITSNII